MLTYGDGLFRDGEKGVERGNMDVDVERVADTATGTVMF